MNNLNYNQNINEIKSNDFKSLKCTLLIPRMYINFLDELLIKESISIENLIKKFSSLIEKNVLIINPILEKHTTKYQSHSTEKLNLIRKHFRSNPLVWHYWKRLANHYGVSMCYLFLICLKKVTFKDLNSVGTPTESRHLHNFIFFEVTNYTRSYSHRWLYSRIYMKRIRKKAKM